MTLRRILHAADIHLDSPLQKLGTYEHAPVQRIRNASRRALENMVRLAIDQSVDLVVIAGDLYDGDWPDQNTGLFFVAQAGKLVKAGIPIVVIRGNHDAANVMTSSLPLPKNPDGSDIMMRSDAVDLRRFESIGIAVHGRSFRTRAESENLAADYPTPLNGMFNLGLLHTSLTGAEGHAPYAPCTPAQLADKRYDYWALGHVHARGHHGFEGAAPVVFSGNIQGRHVRETGPKGCVIVEVDGRNQCTHSFHELDVVRWQNCEIDVSAMHHLDEVVDAYQASLAHSLDQVGDRLLVMRVGLTGIASLHDQLHQHSNQLAASLRAIALSHGGDRTWLEGLKIHTAPPSGKPTIGLDGPMASLAAVVAQLRGDDAANELVGQELRSLVKKLPPEVTAGSTPLPLDDPQWIGELIESSAADVIGRLQTEGTD